MSSGAGAWSRKIYHFYPHLPPSSAGEEIQSEFFVEYHDLPAALEDIYSIADEIRHLVQITEIRAVDQDDIPLSPAKGQKVVGIHFTWYRDFDGIFFAVQKVQEVLQKYDYRVHWGKFFHPRPDFGDFLTFEDDLKNLVDKIASSGQEYDARGRDEDLEDMTVITNPFINCFTERLLFGKQSLPCEFTSNYEQYVHDLIIKKAQGGGSQKQER